jgi:hypothetical protein
MNEMTNKTNPQYYFDANALFKYYQDNIFRMAENILLQHALTFDISSNDALHLAIVNKLQLQPTPILVTSDNSMQKVSELLSIPFYDPEAAD